MTGSHTMMTDTKIGNTSANGYPRIEVDEEGTVFELPRIVVENLERLSEGRFYVLSADIAARGHMGN